MRLLLDTQLLIWLGREPERLSRKAVAVLSRADDRLLFSPLAVAEVAIKHAKGRSDFPLDAPLFRDTLLDNSFEELPLSGVHAARLADLPPIHKDPFDRLMVAQALAEGVPLVTADATLAQYPGQIILV